MERFGAKEYFDDQGRWTVVVDIAGLPPLDVVSVLIGLINVEVEPAVYSLGIGLLRVGGSQINSGLKDDEGGLCVKVLDDLVESLHLNDGVIRRLVLTSRSKVLRRARALCEGRVCP